MKKLIFVGQVNILIEEINHYLSDFFDVQVYEGKSLLDGGLLGDGKPDVILLSLLGMNEEKADIFRRTEHRPDRFFCRKARDFPGGCPKQ